MDITHINSQAPLNASNSSHYKSGHSGGVQARSSIQTKIGPESIEVASPVLSFDNNHEDVGGGGESQKEGTVFELGNAAADHANTGCFGVNEKAMANIIQEQPVVSEEALKNEVENALAKTQARIEENK